jgi:hypothetical protein
VACGFLDLPELSEPLNIDAALAGAAFVLHASAAAVCGCLPLIGKERNQRCSSSASIRVDFPAFRAVNSASRIAMNIRVRLTPVVSAASSGV